MIFSLNMGCDINPPTHAFNRITGFPIQCVQLSLCHIATFSFHSSLFLIMSSIHSSMVLHYPLIPYPVSRSYLISCSFRLYPLVAVFWVLLSLLFFFPAHFSGPCLISLSPPKWPISGSEVPPPNMLLETDLSPYWSTEKQWVLKKSNWGLTSEKLFLSEAEAVGTEEMSLSSLRWPDIQKFNTGTKFSLVSSHNTTRTDCQLKQFWWVWLFGLYSQAQSTVTIFTLSPTPLPYKNIIFHVFNRVA